MICAVLCPRCCHGVELPCSDWSTATACLPLDPTVTFDPGCGAQEEDENEEGFREKTALKPGEIVQQTLTELFFVVVIDYGLTLEGSLVVPLN